MSRLFRHEQVVSASPDRVVEFFHDVRNLPRVSPRFPALEVPVRDALVRPGVVVPVRLSLGPLRRTLTTRILHVAPDGGFTDSIEGGPFKHWEHTHRFEPFGSGTRIVDEIVYTPRPWIGPLAGIALRIMFALRRRAIQRVLQ